MSSSLYATYNATLHSAQTAALCTQRFLTSSSLLVSHSDCGRTRTIATVTMLRTASLTDSLKRSVPQKSVLQLAIRAMASHHEERMRGKSCVSAEFVTTSSDQS